MFHKARLIAVLTLDHGHMLNYLMRIRITATGPCTQWWFSMAARLLN